MNGAQAMMNCNAITGNDSLYGDVNRVRIMLIPLYLVNSYWY